MSEENINIATKEYADAHFGNTSETNDNLVIATKEYVDSIPTGMVMDGTTLKGQLCNPRLVTAVGWRGGWKHADKWFLHVLSVFRVDRVDC